MLIALLSTMAWAGSGELTWTGIDYSLVKMIGTDDFRDPSSIFPGYLSKWNDLFLVEMTGILGRRTGRRIRTSTGHLPALHQQADPSTQIVRDNHVPANPLLNRADVVSHIATAYTPNASGMALTFVADQLNKPKRKGCFWVTYYDQSTLAVHDTTFRCGQVGGVGFRNYWFGSVKNTLDGVRPEQVPDAGRVIELTDAEVAAAGSSPESLAMAQERVAAAKQGVAAAAALSAEERAAAEAKRNWITIRVAPEGLATLSTANIGYDVLGAGQTAVAPTVTEPRVQLVIGAGTGAPVVYGSRADWPKAECETAYGKTACGYHCEVAFGDVKCAGSPNGACEVAFGKITCSN